MVTFWRRAWLVALAASFSATAAVAEPELDRQLSEAESDACEVQIAALRSAKERPATLPEVQAAKVAELEMSLKQCLDTVPLLSPRLRRRCPCREGDLEFSNDEARACKVDLMRLDVLDRQAPMSGSPEPEEFARARKHNLDDAIAELRVCVLKARASGALRLQATELDARVKATISSGRFDPCVAEKTNPRWAALYAILGRGGNEKLTAPDKFYWHRVLETVDECAEEAQSDARLSDPTFAETWLSAQLCYAASSRKRAQAMLKAQRDGARAGLGVIDKDEVYKWQGELLIVARVEKGAKEELARRKMKAKKCVPMPTKEIADCIDSGRQNSTLLLRGGDDEYQASADRISVLASKCIPQDATAPEAVKDTASPP